jgi:hypothetical protein
MNAVDQSNSPAYEPHPHHRSGRAEKSQWLISDADERACFDLAWRRGWCEGEQGWGLHLDLQQRPEVLGRSADRQRALWFAKFVRGSAWHGYPADLARRANRDAPSRAVARDWHVRGHIRRQTLSKLVQGKVCNP